MPGLILAVQVGVIFEYELNPALAALVHCTNQKVAHERGAWVSRGWRHFPCSGRKFHKQP